MTLVGDGFSTGDSLRPFPRLVQESWRTVAFQRLNHALETAIGVPFDDTSRFVFLSDCHRGDSSAVDAFAKNKALYQAALRRYYDDGFTYVEVGDGDELWQNGRFDDILAAHADVFELLHQFDDDRRLHLLIGNHDTYNGFSHQLEKDGIPTHHSLRLTHSDTGQHLLVLHGHQADLTSSRYYTVTRVLCRSIWRWMQENDLVGDTAFSLDEPSPSRPPWRTNPFNGQGKRIEQRIIEWVRQQQIPVICGHTHLPALSGPNAAPYFNSGSCVSAGYITGLELQRGELSLVKWSFDGGGRAVRRLLARPRQLATMLTARWD